MAFESLSFRHTIALPDMPARWLPLIHAYDPDLPLFPIYYFHSLTPRMQLGERATATQRVFGYVERINLTDAGAASATIVTNKDLSNQANAALLTAATAAVRDRLGLSDPVIKQDVTQCFTGALAHANAVLGEIWERVVPEAYGGKLPFGRMWDEVLGLARFVASFYSQSGRKGELIQTHYFASRFGERIQSGGGIPHVDFFLLPTAAELLDATNPLAHFPAFRALLDVAVSFRQLFCEDAVVDGVTFSRFRNPGGGKFNTTRLFTLIEQLNFNLRPAATECFNAFGKGPSRTIIFLMMLADLRSGAVKPDALTPTQCGAIYDGGLRGTYQSPKVIEIYAQQCFANPSAMPIDTWVATFLRWPLKVWPFPETQAPNRVLFANARNLGKVERLIWVAAQARKVHSLACHDALWCLKKSSGDEESDNPARGANPLACNICSAAIRNACPAFAEVRNLLVCFNRAPQVGETFSIATSARDNATPNQSFISVSGESIYGSIVDDFSPRDDPAGFSPFPDPQHGGRTITVDEFIALY